MTQRQEAELRKALRAIALERGIRWWPAVEGALREAYRLGQRRAEVGDDPAPKLGARRFGDDPDEARMVRWPAGGFTRAGIADRLNQAGIRTWRGKAWTRGAVADVLRSARRPPGSVTAD